MKADSQQKFGNPRSDDVVKSPKTPFPVIPAKAVASGGQLFQGVIKPLDSGFHLSARHRQAGVTTFYEAIKE